GGADQHAAAAAPVRQLAAEAGQQVAAGRPAKATDLRWRGGGCDRSTRLAALARRGLCPPRLLARLLLGSALLGRGTGGGRTQVLQQLLQRLRILAQGLLAFLAVLVAGVQLAEQGGALAAVPLELGDLLLLGGAQRLQLGLALGDSLFHRRHLVQRGRQRLYLARVLALGIAVVGQGALGVGGAVLGQQQLQRCLAAERVRGAQQRGQALADLVLVGLQPVAALFQLGQRLGFMLQGGLGFGQFAGAAPQLLVGAAQAGGGIATLALQAAALAGDLLQLRPHLAQFALGGARVALLLGLDHAAGHGQQDAQHRPAPCTAWALGSWPGELATLARLGHAWEIQ